MTDLGETVRELDGIIVRGVDLCEWYSGLLTEIGAEVGRLIDAGLIPDEPDPRWEPLFERLRRRFQSPAMEWLDKVDAAGLLPKSTYETEDDD